MPAHITNEDRWQRAKKKAEEAGHKEDWPYVMAIYLKMNGGKVGSASLERIVRLAQGSKMSSKDRSSAGP